MMTICKLRSHTTLSLMRGSFERLTLVFHGKIQLKTLTHFYEAARRKFSINLSSMEGGENFVLNTHRGN